MNNENAQIEQYIFLTGLLKNYDKYSEDCLKATIEKEQLSA